MSRYSLGAPIRLSTTVKDVNGALANAGALTLTVLKPDLTTQAYATPTNDGTGLYHQDVPAGDLTQIGHYQHKWVSTGANAGVSSGAFDVVDPFDSEVLSLEDARQHLNITSTANDAELETYIAAVTGVVEGIIGPVGRRTVTEVVPASDGGLRLHTTPVLSLTSVTPASGTPLTVGSLTLNSTAGIVYPAAGTSFWGGPFTVVYVAARAAVSAKVNLAARIQLAHLWETQRGGAGGVRVGGFGETPEFAPGPGFAIPNRVLELLADEKLPPAVA